MGGFTTISFFSSLYSCSLDFSGNYDSLYEVRSRTVGYIRTLLTRHTAWVLAEREGYLCGCCNNECDACTYLAAKNNKLLDSPLQVVFSCMPDTR